MDTVSVNLRAVSTKTSEVLSSVTVQKQVASISLQGSVFRYVALDKLLEIEAGVTSNEPKQIAVEEAIDKAVYALIMEGARVGIWKFADSRAGAAEMSAYLQEKYDGTVPAGGGYTAPLATTRPTKLSQTVPVSQVPQSAAAASPATQTESTASTPPPTVPPPANPNETLG